MEPHTARNLKERKYNKLKDFIHVAGPLGAGRATSGGLPAPALNCPVRGRRG